ncbi:amino acid adenylation domain-containing protein, partial [Pseudomonas fontis]
RLSFSEQADGWQAQFKAVAADALLWQTDAPDSAAREVLFEQAQRSLNLQDGPLLRAVLNTAPDGEQRLLLVIHHLVVDGVSWRILLEDLQAGYRQRQAGHPVVLPGKTTSVKAWAEQLQHYARSEALQAELGFWQGQLHGASVDLPGAYSGASLQKRHAHTVHSHLPAQATRQLLQEAPGAYRTQVNDLLLTALARVIARWTGAASVLVQLEGHGREELFEQQDLTRSVGWFTSLFPARLTPSAHIGDSIKQVKEQLRAIPNKGIGFAALRYLGDDASRATLKALPVPRITFNYLGQFDGSFEQVDGSLFVPAGENGGAAQAADAPLANGLTLNGQVFGGELSLGWTFSREQFDEAAIQALADDYSRELHALVEHCLAPQHQGVTPSDFALANLTQAQLDGLPYPAQQIEDIYPLSPMQQGMLFHTLYEQSRGHYVNQLRVDVDGLDPQRFRAAWQATLEAQDSLRSAFVWQGDLERPVQVLLKALQVPFTQLDWQGRNDVARALDTLAAEELEQGFDLAAAPLLRLQLVQLSAQRYHLIYTHHHILMDGWSSSQLLGEVLQRYHGQPVPRARGRFRDYIQWLQAQDGAASEAFWKQQLANLDEPTRLVQLLGGLGEAADAAYGQADLHQRIESAGTRKLSEFARQQKVTVNTLLQAAWLVLLQRYSGQSTVTFGATVAGRPAELEGVEQQVGLFINSLPVIASPAPQQTVGDWLQQVQAQNLALREHEHTPLFEIQRWAGQSGTALFDSLLVFENYPVSEALQQGSGAALSFGPLARHELANYPLTLAIGLGETLGLHFSYDQAHFNAATIARLGEHLQHLLMQMADAAQARLCQLELLDGAAREAVIAHWNAAPVSHPDIGCLHQRIEAQVARTPQAIAVVLDGQTLTYQQLNQQANRLAHALIARGVGPDVLVGIATERRLAMPVALLAVLKAGGAYVPLDPHYPQDRLSYMMRDSGLHLLLAEASVVEQLDVPAGVETLLLDDLPNDYAGFSEHNPNVAMSTANLAYVIYTSGSTGQPKGTLLPHCNVLRLFQATEAWLRFDATDVWSLFHSYAFDFSVWEIFGALLHGGKLVIVPHEVSRSPQQFLELLGREGVTVLNQTPSAFKQLMQVACALPAEVGSGALRHVIFGGEALEVKSLRPWFERFGDRAPRLINMYGITETTVHVTYRPLTLADLERDASSPIGLPIDDLSWYLFDSELNPVPPGCIGELYIGRAGLARGYLNRADLSATRFIPDPYGQTPGGRLYRTGDLARYRVDGVIEYVGRIDQQVKVRGFRIELGEIEASLLDHPAVSATAVLALAGANGTQLVGYVVAAPGTDAGALREHLREVLPDYMVPTHLVFIEQLPLTANGKLDRKALPAPDASLHQHAYVAPVTELEQQVAAIWQDVLKLEQVGLDDDFFELGGHSLTVVNVVSRLQLELGLTLTPQLLFRFPQLKTFVEQLETTAKPLNTSKLSKLEALLDEMEEF